MIPRERSNRSGNARAGKEGKPWQRRHGQPDADQASKLPTFLNPLRSRASGLSLPFWVSAVLTIIVNRKFVPKEYRGSLFREIMLVLGLLFFGFFFLMFLTHPGGLAKALGRK